jgi:hypothetical protein
LRNWLYAFQPVSKPELTSCGQVPASISAASVQKKFYLSKFRILFMCVNVLTDLDELVKYFMA